MVAIFVALMFIGLVLVDLILQRAEARRAAVASQRARDMGIVPRSGEMAGVGTFPSVIPQGVYFSEAHAWFRPTASSEVHVGADALIAHAIGGLDQVTLPKPGDFVKKGQPLFRLVRDQRSLTISSSVTGKVSAVNDRLRDHPEHVANEPYGAGWVCTIIPTILDDGSGGLRLGEKAAFWLECELERFREFVSSQILPDLELGATSQDGGLPAAGALSLLDEKAWAAFETEFLRP
jgi:glycine cleavage system H protein